MREPFRTALLFGGALAACATLPVETVSTPAPERATAELGGLADVAARALPAVVLLLNTRPDGKIGYGAGLIVSDDGLVLTNLHVVADASPAGLGALLHDPNRPSYTPMDGGLQRFIFENQREVVRARLLRADSTADLAIVKIDADTSSYRRLPFARQPVRPGEPVLALGHPRESVWSFTSGVVSALHRGAIQHDAAVNTGNSGGPLLNARGEVVGINTSRRTDGVAFARPIALAGRLVAGEVAGADFTLDLTAPDRAVLSCIRAQELASSAIVGCFDWERRWAVVQAALREVRERLGGDPAALAALDGRVGAKERWLEEERQATLAYFSLQAKKPAQPVAGPAAPPSPSSNDGPLGAVLDEAVAKARALKARRYEQLRQKNGLRVDLTNPNAVQEVLRMGVRVEKVSRFGPGGDGRAWVLVSGRNLDGSLYQFSECWAKVGDRWLQQSPPAPEEVAALPFGWAPPLESFEGAQASAAVMLLKAPFGGFDAAGTPAAPER